MKVVEAKEMSRTEIQEALKPVLEEFLARLEAPRNAALVRRFYRSLVHIAAEGIRDNQGGPEDFLYMFQAAWSKELEDKAVKGDAVLVVTPEVPKGAN